MSRAPLYLACLAVVVATRDLAAQSLPQQLLAKPDFAAGDTFGAALAMRGARLAIGSPLDDGLAGTNTGAVSTYVRIDGTWLHDFELHAPDAADNDAFGCALALDGDLLAIGARTRDEGSELDVGAVYLFRRNADVWVFDVKLVSPEPQAFAQFGAALALDGARLVIGAPLYTFEAVASVAAPAQVARGAAYVYELVAGQWTYQYRLAASHGESDDRFGTAIALAGTRAIVGAPGAETSALAGAAGAAYVFEVGGYFQPEYEWWKQVAELQASDAASHDGFGSAVALHGERVIVGAPNHEQAAPAYDRGSAYVFERTNETWNQIAQLFASDAMDQAYFGASVALGPLRALVGSPGHNFGRGRGYVLVDADGMWTEALKLVAAGAQPKDELCGAVALDGNHAVGGARYDKLLDVTYAGSVSAWESLLTPVASAEPRLPCSVNAPPHSLEAPAGPPVLGTSLIVALDDPSGVAALVPASTLGMLAYSTQPAPFAPCGVVLPGLGGPLGVGSELLVSIDGADLFALKFGGVWKGPAQPLVFAHAVPSVSALAGLEVHAQGLLVDTTNNALVLSNGLDLVLGY